MILQTDTYTCLYKKNRYKYLFFNKIWLDIDIEDWFLGIIVKKISNLNPTPHENTTETDHFFTGPVHAMLPAW